MMIPSIHPPQSTFSASIKPFINGLDFSSSHMDSSEKITDEEKRTKLPPIQFYYDQLNRDLAAKSRCRRSASLDEYMPHNGDVRYNGKSPPGFVPKPSIKIQNNPFEAAFYKKNFQSEDYQTVNATPYNQQRRRIQSASSIPYGDANRTIPFTLPYFTSRHELPRYESARFSMSNLLRPGSIEPNAKLKQEEDDQNRQEKCQLAREYSSESGYLSDSSSYTKTAALLHDKNGRFPELRKEEDGVKHGCYPTHNVLPSINTLRTYESHVQKMLLERESMNKRTATEAIAVQCTHVDSSHTNEEIKYGVEGLLGLTKVANEQLGPAVVKEKKRTKNNNCLHLWQFLRRMLNDEQYKTNRCIEWTNREVGEFRLIKTAVIADLWGQSKNRKCMTYEKMARAMRYYYKMKILEKVPHKRLHFRFGEKMLSKVLDHKPSKINYDPITYTNFIQRNHTAFHKYPAADQYVPRIKQEPIEQYPRQSVICPINSLDSIDQASQTSCSDGQDSRRGEIRIADTADESFLTQPTNDVMDKLDEHIDVENSDEDIESNSACTTPVSSHDGDVELESSFINTQFTLHA